MADDVLSGKNPTTNEEDGQRIEEFVTRMVVKMAKGKEEHGVDNRFDPLREAMEECVDLANYSMVMYFRLVNLRKKIEEIA